MGTLGIVMATPILNQDLHLSQIVKDLPIEQFVPSLAIEAIGEVVQSLTGR
jgi:hypothetical protein